MYVKFSYGEKLSITLVILTSINLKDVVIILGIAIWYVLTILFYIKVIKLNMKLISFVLPVIILFSSCASILNGKYQKIAINTDKNNTVLINGDVAKKEESGKYKFKRDRIPKQITVSQDGYKDETITVIQYKKSPLFILSIIPFGVFWVTPALDGMPKSVNYSKSFEVGTDMIPVPKRKENSKYIKLNKVKVELEGKDIKEREFSTYRRYMAFKDTREAQNSEMKEKLVIKNTIFPKLLNGLLKENGYVDTSHNALKNSYSNNLLINATINNYTTNIIRNYIGNSEYGGMIYLDTKVEWEVIDYYSQVVYSLSTNCVSGQYYYFDKHGISISDAAIKAFKDALETGLIKFMNSDVLKKLLHDKSEEKREAEFSKIQINKSKIYVKTLADAIKSSVTVKNEKGHGSGFFISQDGYIITNYHVIAEKKVLKVVMNDESVHEAKIIRVSKINDLALLKIDVSNIVPFEISTSEEIDIAMDIYAVGTPASEDLSQTISKGIISGVRKTGENSKLIQTDASINGGNSGGAIVDKKGLVYGVVSSKLKGFGIEGVAFGIPAYEIFDKLKISIK